MMDTFPDTTHWVYFPTLLRLILGVGIGVFVGLEREHHGKAGARTFASAALLGCIGGLLGDNYALLTLAFTGMLVAFLNWRQWHQNKSLALTTSLALMIVALAGVLCGKGHTFTPVAIVVFLAALLAWKQPLTGFATGLSEAELRSAILLAILSFVIYPVLPDKAIDPYGLIEPRSTWATVILIAALGFLNYLLWKIYGARGVAITSFLGGLVNSTAAVAELSQRAKETGPAMLDTVFRGVLLATAAMLLRNGVLLAILDRDVLVMCALPLILMLVASAMMASRHRSPPQPQDEATPVLRLESPFSLRAALKFGFVFLALHIAGVLAQKFLGAFGFYVVSLAGGLFSSASAVAAAATLAAHGQISEGIAATGVILASITSALVNLPLISRVAQQQPLTVSLCRALGLVAVIGLAGVFVQTRFVHLPRFTRTAPPDTRQAP